MNRKSRPLLSTMALVVLLLLQSGVSTALAQAPGGPPRGPQLPPIPIAGDTTHTLTRHFGPASTAKKTPNAKGFIQRWLVLEPVKKDIARNSILTDSFLRKNFAADLPFDCWRGWFVFGFGNRATLWHSRARHRFGARGCKGFFATGDGVSAANQARGGRGGSPARCPRLPRR